MKDFGGTDAAIKKHLENADAPVKVLSIDNDETVRLLDDKAQFLKEARFMGIPVPSFYKISCCQDVVDLYERKV